MPLVFTGRRRFWNESPWYLHEKKTKPSWLKVGHLKALQFCHLVLWNHKFLYNSISLLLILQTYTKTANLKILPFCVRVSKPVLTGPYFCLRAGLPPSYSTSNCNSHPDKVSQINCVWVPSLLTEEAGRQRGSDAYRKEILSIRPTRRTADTSQIALGWIGTRAVNCRSHSVRNMFLWHLTCV